MGMVGWGAKRSYSGFSRGVDRATGSDFDSLWAAVGIVLKWVAILPYYLAGRGALGIGFVAVNVGALIGSSWIFNQLGWRNSIPWSWCIVWISVNFGAFVTGGGFRHGRSHKDAFELAPEGTRLREVQESLRASYLRGELSDEEAAIEWRELEANAAQLVHMARRRNAGEIDDEMFGFAAKMTAARYREAEARFMLHTDHSTNPVEPD